MPPQQNDDIQKKIDDLLKRVETLESWKAEEEVQQLTFPLDYISQQVIAGSFSGFTGSGSYTTFVIKAGVVVKAS